MGTKGRALPDYVKTGVVKSIVEDHLDRSVVAEKYKISVIMVSRILTRYREEMNK